MFIGIQKNSRCSLSEPVPALELDAKDETAGKPIVTKLPAGQKLEVEEPGQDLRGMVKVLAAGKTYAVFLQDLVQRADSVKNEP
jgi:hypothetical protein